MCAFASACVFGKTGERQKKAPFTELAKFTPTDLSAALIEQFALVSTLLIPFKYLFSVTSALRCFLATIITGWSIDKVSTIAVSVATSNFTRQCEEKYARVAACSLRSGK